jgi:hypothetical protein
LGFFCNFLKTGQSKQSPIGRKFAQSGHPGIRYGTLDPIFLFRARFESIMYRDRVKSVLLHFVEVQNAEVQNAERQHVECQISTRILFLPCTNLILRGSHLTPAVGYQEGSDEFDILNIFFDIFSIILLFSIFFDIFNIFSTFSIFFDIFNIISTFSIFFRHFQYFLKF